MPKAAKATGIAAEIAAMKSIGMTDEQIRAHLTGQAPNLPQVVMNAPQNAHQRQDQNLGPDPEMVARHQAFLANYKPPVLEETFEVTLDKRRADYVRRWAGWQSALRKGEVITPERAIDLMVRRLWQLDPDRAQIGGIGSGTAMPRQHFNAPPAGEPPSVPQG